MFVTSCFICVVGSLKGWNEMSCPLCSILTILTINCPFLLCSRKGISKDCEQLFHRDPCF